MKKGAVAGLVAFLLAAAWPAWALSDKLTERLDRSAAALDELMKSPDSSIPQDLLEKCEAIVIFPRTLNLAWGLGGEYGRGVALRHDKKSGRWSPPVFYFLGGLTLGPQIGGQAVDIVLVVMNEKGLQSLLKSKSTLGGDAGIALGPAGRNATASTDLGLGAEIYSYSRAKGLYIGLSLKGAVVTPDREANGEYYGHEVLPADILMNKTGSFKPEDRKLLATVGRYVPSKAASFLGWGILVVALGLAAAWYLKNKK